MSYKINKLNCLNYLSSEVVGLVITTTSKTNHSEDYIGLQVQLG